MIGGSMSYLPQTDPLPFKSRILINAMSSISSVVSRSIYGSERPANDETDSIPDDQFRRMEFNPSLT